jgi:hypothetical protein
MSLAQPSAHLPVTSPEKMRGVNPQHPWNRQRNGHTAIFLWMFWVSAVCVLLLNLLLNFPWESRTLLSCSDESRPPRSLHVQKWLYEIIFNSSGFSPSPFWMKRDDSKFGGQRALWLMIPHLSHPQKMHKTSKSFTYSSVRAVCNAHLPHEGSKEGFLFLCLFLWFWASRMWGRQFCHFSHTPSPFFRFISLIVSLVFLHKLASDHNTPTSTSHEGGIAGASHPPSPESRNFGCMRTTDLERVTFQVLFCRTPVFYRVSEPSYHQTQLRRLTERNLSELYHLIYCHSHFIFMCSLEFILYISNRKNGLKLAVIFAHNFI